MVSFSIITPVFNLIRSGREDTFRQTVNSVAAQSWPAVEHVVADGVSNDGTVEFVEYVLAEKSRSIFVSKKDRNLYGGNNNGAEASTGDYLMFINSDDYLIDSHIVETLTRAVEKERPSLVFGSIQRLDEAGVFQRSCPPGTNIFLRQMPFSTQAMAVRRDVFFSLSGFDESFPILADYDFFWRLLFRYPDVMQMDEDIAVFRTGGVSGDYQARRREIMDVWAKNYGRFTSGFDVDWERAQRRRCFPFRLLWAIWRSSGDNAIVRGAVAHEFRRSLRRVVVL